MEFKDWLKEERKKHGYSAKKLSEMLGRSPSYLSQLERGLIKDVTHEMALEIVKLLGLDDDVLNQFYLEQGTLKNARDELKELIDSYNKIVASDDWKIYPDKNQEEENLRKAFETALDKHVNKMQTHELAGLLLLLQKQRNMLYELSTIPSTVKSDKVTYVYDIITIYITHVKQLFKKEEKTPVAVKIESEKK